MHTRRALLAIILVMLWCGPAVAGMPPPGFQETVHLSGIFQLTGFDWAPNGDLWLISKDGKIRVQRAGASSPTRPSPRPSSATCWLRRPISK